MSRTQPPIHRPRLPINITRLVPPQKQRHPRNLIRQAPPAQRVQLPNPALRASFPGGIVRRARHARFGQARAEGVAADVGAGELVAGRLHERDDGRFRGAVVGAARVGAEPGDGGGRDDGAAWVGLGGRGLEHGAGGVFGCEEDAGVGGCWCIVLNVRGEVGGGDGGKVGDAPEDVGPHDLHEFVDLDVREDLVGAHDACVGEHDVQTAVFGQRFVDDGFYGGLVASVELAHVDVDGGVEG